MIKTRCKFVVESVNIMQGNQRRAILVAITRADCPENAAFWKYTPAGKLDLTVDNGSIDDMLPGQEFYLDLTLADPV